MAQPDPMKVHQVQQSIARSLELIASNRGSKLPPMLERLEKEQAKTKKTP